MLPTLRPVRVTDADFLFALANDRAVRASSFRVRRIGWREHLAWLRTQLDGVGRLCEIVEADGESVGLVRAEWRDAEAQISIALAPVARGQGIGTAAVAALAAKARKELGVPVVALIKADNVRSQKMFERAGFHFIGERAEPPCYAYAYR